MDLFQTWSRQTNEEPGAREPYNPRLEKDVWPARKAREPSLLSLEH